MQQQPAAPEASAAVGAPPVHLAGITSLTNLLSRLPLPSATPEGGGGQTLLNTPQMHMFAQQMIHSNNPALVSPLLAALSRTETSMIALKEPYNRAPKAVDPAQLPELGRALLMHNPMVFVQPEMSAAAPVTPRAPSGPASQTSDHVSSPPQAQRPPTAHEAFANGLEPRQSISASGSGSSEPHTPATPGSASMAGEQPIRRDQTQLRKQIVSVGKQPKAHSRRKKDMVSELFDSLTPAAEYFADTSRRRRAPARTYNEEDYEKISLNELNQSTSAQDLEMMLADSTPMFPGRRARKRPRDEDAMDELDRPLTPTEVIHEREREWHEIMKRKKEKYKRRKDDRPYWDTDELLEHEVYRNFVHQIDQSIEDIEELDLAAGDEEDEIPQECLIDNSTLVNMRHNAHKLKRMCAMNRVPMDRLVKLLTILEKNVRDVTQQERMVPFFEEKEEDEMDDQFRQLVDARVLRAADAAVTILTILTSYKMPKQVYIEDAIERCIQLVKQMNLNVIFPAYDASYRTSQQKGTDMKPKKEPAKARGRKSTQTAPETQNNHSKTVQKLYSRMTELMSCFAELVELQPLTETGVLQLATLAIAPFFVENINDMCLSALKLSARIFHTYDKYRKVMMEDVKISLHRLPSSKSARHAYRLSAEEYVQMLPVLMMHVVQSTARVPQSSRARRADLEDDDAALYGVDNKPQPEPQETDVMVLTSYDEASKHMQDFLGTFLNRCTSKSEEDYRRSFGDVLHDFLAALYNPAYPSAELALTQLGGMLINSFRATKLDMSLRVASLDYLGTITARLRKGEVESKVDEDKIDDIVLQLSQDEDDFDNSHKQARVHELSENKIQILKRALIDYVLGENENDDRYAVNFYISQWYKDEIAELEKVKEGGTGAHSGDVGGRTTAEHEKYKAAMQQAAANKQFLLSLVDRADELRTMNSEHRATLSDEQATFVAKYLASNRSLSQSFNVYLGHIMNGVLSENAVGIRTKAMKSLTQVIEVDPEVLARSDVQRVVRARLTDNSSGVREATIELIGKYMLTKPELIDKYYEMIADRILDTAISVRKRVIKILREICEKRPDFSKVPLICARVVRRVNDEDSIKKLVNETFTHLWFTPVREKDTAAILKKVATLTDAVAKCCENSLECMETLLSNLVKSNSSNMQTASKQIVNTLVEMVVQLDADSNRHQLHACLTSIFLFSKVSPTLLVRHADTLLPYLTMSTSGPSEQQVLVQVINILERVVPLMDHPSKDFLDNLELSLLNLVKRGAIVVVNASISCLAAIIHKHKRSYDQVYKLFRQYYQVVSESNDTMSKTGTMFQVKLPLLQRGIHGVGLMCRYFDFEIHQQEEKPTWSQKVFDNLVFFMNCREEKIRTQSFTALGQICARQPEFLLNPDLMRSYRILLQQDNPNFLSLKIQTLRNIELFLQAEEQKMMDSYAKWQQSKEAEDLKEMGDASSGMGSTVIQSYWNQTQECFYNPSVSVRIAASQVIVRTLQQGLVTPALSIPTLIAMTSDPEQQVKNKADSMLKEINTKYSGIVPTKAAAGMGRAYVLHKIIHDDEVKRSQKDKKPWRPLRGLPSNPLPDSGALLSHLYSLIRGSKTQRRSFLNTLLRSFHDSAKTCLEQLVFTADNLATFPYQTLEEPLYVIHVADSIISISAPNCVQTFQENLLPKYDISHDDDDENQAQIFARLPVHGKNLDQLYVCLTASQGCYLLLYLKEYLRQLYGITDSRSQEYSPSDSKPYEKNVTRRSIQKVFFPQSALEEMDPIICAQRNSIEGRSRLALQFVTFRTMMMQMDSGSEAGDQPSSRQSTPAPVQVIQQ